MGLKLLVNDRLLDGGFLLIYICEIFEKINCIIIVIVSGN